jgi:Methyltransferase domain
MQNIVIRAKNSIVRDGLGGFARKALKRSKEFLTGRYELSVYDDEFFRFILADSRPQAEWLAPKIANEFGVRSVIDLGCASGHWVDAFMRAGADARGIEGSESAKASLVCAEDRVKFADLRFPLTDAPSHADLVMSIEVAEHIEEKYADTFLANIVRYTPNIILLTAATPGQGGHYHVNEQPQAYWISKMAALGYQFDEAKAAIISKFINEGQELENVPEIMKHPTAKHDGVWFPDWISTNLLVFSRMKTGNR